MAARTTDKNSQLEITDKAGERVFPESVSEHAVAGRAPLKVVTGVQRTSELSFELKPGAIVAHTGASVIFVCG